MTNYRDLATEFSLVFDLDGTLIDSAPDLQAAVNTVLSSHGLRRISMEETQAFIGDGMPNSVNAHWKRPVVLQRSSRYFMTPLKNGTCRLLQSKPNP